MQILKRLPATAALLLAAAAAFYLTVGQAAPAGERASAVAGMLSRIPFDAVDPDQLFQVQYGSPEKGFSTLLIEFDSLEAKRIQSTARGLPPEIAELLLMQSKGAKALVGFDMTDIRESASISQQGLLMTLYRLDPGIDDAVGPALDALGYDRNDRSGMPVWARGEDFALDMANRNTANPFGGRLGRWGRVAVDNDLVAWSPAWAPIDGFASGQRAVASHPQIAALLGVLDQPQTENGTLLNARFIIDPKLRTGSPAVMTTDMVSGKDDMALLAVVVPPEHNVDALSERVEWNWHNVPMRGVNGPVTFSDHFGGAVEISVIANSNPILLIQIIRERENISFNSVFARVQNLVFGGDLEILLAPHER